MTTNDPVQNAMRPRREVSSPLESGSPPPPVSPADCRTDPATGRTAGGRFVIVAILVVCCFLGGTAFAKRIKSDTSAVLPKPDKKDKAAWPARDDGGHASLVTGYNPDRGEILFTESWLNDYRHRRMRTEEMEGTTYVIFYFNP